MSTNNTSDQFKQLLDDDINLPSPPAIAVQILNTVQNSESSLSDFEDIISADPALTGKMLRIANSAFYSLPYEVGNIARALSVLGTNVIKNIALSFVISKDMRSETQNDFSFDYFWKRSVVAGVAAELLQGVLKQKDEDIFVTALLQDIGILVMYLSKGEEYVKPLKECIVNGGIGLIEKEREQYQFDHQQLGFLLLEKWGIPQSITTPMRYHHEPEVAPPEFQQKAAVLSISNILSAIYSGTETSSNYRILQTKMQELFELDDTATRSLLDDVAKKSVDILNIFEIEYGQMKPYSQMLQEANDELGKLNLSYEQLVLELKESKDKSEKFANELRRANEQLEKLAFRDSLTDLYNHRYFQEILTKEIARARRYNHPLSLIMFDIDHFKAVNDTYGHPAGDQVLKNIAAAISSAMRPTDILARYGGEEFAVILPETAISGMKVFGERLRRTIAAVITKVNGIEIKVTVSLGGAQLTPTDTISQQLLIDLADKALYQAKNKGRNQIVAQLIKE